MREDATFVEVTGIPWLRHAMECLWLLSVFLVPLAFLDRDYIINPRVTIEVVNYRPFYILGQVNRPGSYSYVEGMTVRMAIAIAGGFTRRADEDTVIIVRANDPAQTLVEAGLGERVLPGDSIEVERRLF